MIFYAALICRDVCSESFRSHPPAASPRDATPMSVRRSPTAFARVARSLRRKTGSASSQAHSPTLDGLGSVEIEVLDRSHLHGRIESDRFFGGGSARERSNKGLPGPTCGASGDQELMRIQALRCSPDAGHPRLVRWLSRARHTCARPARFFVQELTGRVARTEA